MAKITVIRKQKKIKTLNQAKDRDNWALLEHPGTERLPAGRYLICPCCAGPYLESVENELKEAGKELEEAAGKLGKLKEKDSTDGEENTKTS